MTDRGRLPHRGRLGLAGTLLTLALCCGPAAATDARAAGAPAPSQDLVVLAKTHRVVSSLSRNPSRVGTIRAGRPITGARTVLPVIDWATKNGVDRVRVMLPGRPNGLKGWITKHATIASSTPWHIVIRTAKRRVGVFRAGRLVRNFTAIVGTASTPTPHGRFFVEESVAMPTGSPGGPFALALSARSNVLQEFMGGPGQIAIHGVKNLGGVFGTASSHGCVRLRNKNIRWLSSRVGGGTPVTIIR